MYPLSREKKLEAASSILSTAMEGGSGYWCQVEGYRWSDKPRFKVEPLKLFELDETEGSYTIEHQMDEEKILKAIEELAKGVPGDYSGIYAVCHGLLDMGTEQDFDANDADFILQHAVFGKQVYG